MNATLDRRALGRALTQLANASVADVLRFARTQPEAVARRIGLTGPPGVGKSSLGGRLALARTADRRIGLLAIDPTSPRTGGAILGDRVRIDELTGAGELFVRSLASRTANDGLADNLPELLEAMDAAGFDEILVETVGVGQAEHAARSQVDTLVLVLNPESGDMVQAMKAGIMELADIYVINKADLPGAPRIAAEIRRVLQLAPPAGWQAPVVLTSIDDPDSVARLSAEIDRHQSWLAGSGTQAERSLERARYRLRNLIERQVAETVAALPPSFFARDFAQQYRDALSRLVHAPS
jgi:LAO/AO transport system kinase